MSEIPGKPIHFTFFARAKKVTKKAQPILMRNISLVGPVSAKIGVQKRQRIDHFCSNDKQDGVNSLCCTPDADRVIKIIMRDVCVVESTKLMGR